MMTSLPGTGWTTGRPSSCAAIGITNGAVGVLGFGLEF
jgi:hypothetical protein